MTKLYGLGTDAYGLGVKVMSGLGMPRECLNTKNRAWPARFMVLGGLQLSPIGLMTQQLDLEVRSSSVELRSKIHCSVLSGQRICDGFQHEVRCEEIDVFFVRFLYAVTEGVDE